MLEGKLCVYNTYIYTIQTNRLPYVDELNLCTFLSIFGRSSLAMWYTFLDNSLNLDNIEGQYNKPHSFSQDAKGRPRLL